MKTQTNSRSMDDLSDLALFVDDTPIPDKDVQRLGGPIEIEDWIELQVSSLRPTEYATVLLRGLADSQQRPELG